MDPYATSHFSNAALRQDLKSRKANDCKSTAVFLSRIGEFDDRRLFLEDGYSSMHSYCVYELHACEGTASRWIYGARAARRFPVLFDAVADGRLHLTAVLMLSKYLTSGNVDDLVAAATHRSKAEVAQLIANRFPRPDLPQRLAAIPPALVWSGSPDARDSPENTDPAVLATAPLTPGPTHSYGPASSEPPSSPPAPGPAPQYSLENVHAVVTPTTPLSAQYSPANTPVPAPRGKVTPLAPERFGLQVTLDQETYELLQEARALTSHQHPGGEIGQVLKHALRDYVANLRKRKFAATARPRNGSQSEAKPQENGGKAARHIPAEVKREVCERDQGCCTFVSENGKRCGTRTLLQFDHVEPVARGGRSTVENLRLRCAAHNQHAADREFGVEFMDQKRRSARERVRPARRESVSRARGVPTTPALARPDRGYVGAG